MLKAATVTWTNRFSLRSGEKLGLQLVEELGSLPDACWIFCARREGLQSFLNGIAKAVKTPYLIGCTTDGEIAGDGFHQNSAVLAGLVAPQMGFHLCWEENLDADGEETGRRLARQMPDGVRFVQIFSDGLTGNGCALLRGLQDELGPTMPISGGTAADGERFQRTHQFAGSRLLTNAAVALGFLGDFHLGLGVNSGWTPVGIGKKVTRAQGHILYELDGEPALEVYRRFLGKHAERLPAVGVEYPLALMDGASMCAHQDLEYPYLLRATMAVNPEEGSIQFAGEIPQGASVHLTCGDSQSLLEATEAAVHQALAELEGAKPALAFAFCCMARRILLGRHTREEAQRIMMELGPVPLVGFYTYGEFSPAQQGTPCVLHNETATLAIIG
jgi:hypothetical protein